MCNGDNTSVCLIQLLRGLHKTIFMKGIVNSSRSLFKVIVLMGTSNFIARGEYNTHAHTHTHTEVAQSCPTLCDPMDCSPPGSLVHGIFQAWILEWVAVSFSRGFSWPRDRTRASRIVSRRFTVWATREAHQKHRRVVVSFKRLSVEIFYRWNLLPRSQLANYMHSWRQEAAKKRSSKRRI